MVLRTLLIGGCILLCPLALVVMETLLTVESLDWITFKVNFHHALGWLHVTMLIAVSAPSILLYLLAWGVIRRAGRRVNAGGHFLFSFLTVGTFSILFCHAVPETWLPVAGVVGFMMLTGYVLYRIGISITDKFHID